MDNEKLKCRDFRIYKPTKAGTGAASNISITSYFNDKEREKVVVFIDTALQIPSEGEYAAFGWKDKDKKITVKLDDNDIGEMLLVLTGGKEGLGAPDGKGGFKGLFHKNKNGNTVIRLEYIKDRGLMYSVSTQRPEGNFRVGHALTDGEGAIIAEILKAYIHMKYVSYSAN